MMSGEMHGWQAQLSAAKGEVDTSCKCPVAEQADWYQTACMQQVYKPHDVASVAVVKKPALNLSTTTNAERCARL